MMNDMSYPHVIWSYPHVMHRVMHRVMHNEKLVKKWTIISAEHYNVIVVIYTMFTL